MIVHLGFCTVTWVCPGHKHPPVRDRETTETIWGFRYSSRLVRIWPNSAASPPDCSDRPCVWVREEGGDVCLHTLSSCLHCAWSPSHPGDSAHENGHSSVHMTKAVPCGYWGGCRVTLPAPAKPPNLSVIHQHPCCRASPVGSGCWPPPAPRLLSRLPLSPAPRPLASSRLGMPAAQQEQPLGTAALAKAPARVQLPASTLVPLRSR